jgi:hypothetical protein
MVPPDDQQFLARRRVPPRWVVVGAAVAHVHAFDEGIVKGAAALDYSSAHGAECMRSSAECHRFVRAVAAGAPSMCAGRVHSHLPTAECERVSGPTSSNGRLHGSTPFAAASRGRRPSYARVISARYKRGASFLARVV